MTLKVRKDQLPYGEFDFAAHVTVHAKALNEYRAHLRGVAEDAENPNLKLEERRVAFPGPDAPNLIKSAITLDGATDQYVPDYELVGPPLAERKAALTQRVREMEQAAIEANIPAAKRRHWQFVYADALNQIAIDKKNGFPPTIAEAAIVEQNEERFAKEVAIQRWAAKLEHDIADLTDETIDAFACEPFNG